jgi:aspartate aminotransferase
MSRAFVPSPNVAALRESATIAVSARARELKARGRPVIDLGAGEPDFDTPEFIRRAAAQAVEGGATRYTAVEGILPLRQAIAADAARLGARVDPAEVVVTTGSKQALFNACFALFGEGDEVLVPTPGWTSYYEMLSLARATPVAVLGDAARDFRVGVPELAAATTSRTRGLVLNSPCNPTGAVYPRDELAALLGYAAERGWWVIADEIYRRIAYDGPAASLLGVATVRDRLVVVDGVAKAYAMTGWRLGWAIAPREVARSITALQSHTTSNASSMAQHAALAALTEHEAADRAIGAMVARFDGRRRAALALLDEAPSMPRTEPRGAFYLFLDVSPTAPNDPDAGTAFARRLLEEHDVAIVPGAAFLTPRWVRVSYAAPDRDVVEGVRRLVALFRSIVGG